MAKHVAIGVSTSLILDQTFTLLRHNATRSAIAFAAMTLLAVLNDLRYGEGTTELMLSVITTIFQFWLTAYLLDDLTLRRATRGRFPAFFVLSLLTVLGVLCGLILLILPGIYLMARWSISVPAVVATDDPVFDAIGYSWRATERSAWQILAAYLAVYVPALLCMLIGLVILTEFSAVLAAVVYECSFSAGIIIGWHVAVATYAETRREVLYSEVFA